MRMATTRTGKSQDFTSADEKPLELHAAAGALPALVDPDSQDVGIKSPITAYAGDGDYGLFS
jgi:hypothetical protein